MKFFIILISLFIFIFAEDINLLKPKSSIYDFTYDNKDANPTTYKADNYVNKIELSVEKIVANFPRDMKIFGCKNDTYGNIYCPTALAPANNVWDYDNGYSTPKTAIVTDYATGTYATHTGSVRDFVNGTSAPHANTEINYSNGSSNTYTGSVIDYTSKQCFGQMINGRCYDYGTQSINSSQSLSCVSQTVPCMPGASSCCTININCTGGSSATVTYNDCCHTTNVINVSDVSQFLNGVKYNKFSNNESAIVCNNVGSCSIYFQNYYCGSGESIDDAFLTNTFNVSTTTNYFCSDNRYYTGSALGADPSKCYLPKDLSCPSTYTPNASNCSKNVNFNFYSYGCPNGYSPQNSGFTSFTKTDPDTNSVNDYTLDDAVNSPTPPTNNCVQTLYSTAYEYLCSNGYIPINQGLTKCPVGTSGSCNSAMAPTSNCYKDVSYVFYEYTCPSGYNVNNYGLKTCVKTDPNGTVNNEATLNDDCNSPIPPVGNCSKSIQYTYYDYLCNSSLNEQYIPYKPTNVGGNCNKIDTDKVNVNSNLSNACNSSTPPTNNCKRLNYSCNQNDTKPALVDGEWKCSPYLCNGDKMCGYGTCLDKDISANEFMPSTMVPIKPTINSASTLCNKNYEYSNGNSVQHFIKYCDAGEIVGGTCLEFKNGVCYKYETSNVSVKCTQTKTTCDSGFTKVNGVCTKEPIYSYTYYTYSCDTDTNSFNQKWELVNNKTSDPGCIDDTFGNCISFDKEFNNCRRSIYACPLGGGCKLNSTSKWECTTGGNVDTKCTGIICDLVRNSKVSYCVTGECPKVNGIYEVNGYCKLKSCPDNTYEVNGRCVKE